MNKLFSRFYFICTFMICFLSASMLSVHAQEDRTDLYPKRVFEYKVKDMPIQEAVEVLMSKSGLNIIVDYDIDTKVNLFLNDMMPKDIVRILVDNYGLAYIDEQGEIRILTREKYRSIKGFNYGQRIKTKMIPLLHADVDDVSEVLEQMRSQNGKVIFNQDTSTFILIDAPDKIENMISYIKKVDVPIETREYTLKYITSNQIADRIKAMLTVNVGKMKTKRTSFVVTDTLLKLAEIKKLVDEVDQAEKEIRIQAKIIQIVLNDEHVQGVDWEAIVSGFQETEFLGLKNAIEGKNKKISWGSVSDEDYKVLLEALDTVGEISDVHEQEFMGFKNNKYELTVRPLEIISLIPEEKAYVDRNGSKTDVAFDITPLGYKEDTINVLIQPEVLSLKEESSEVAVEDGSTVVIGGLFKEVTVETERRIPLLSDIPLIRNVPFQDIPILGFPFRNSKRRERLTEVIIFLSVETINQETL